MSKEEMICKNCKYHYIEEISFDYPQSCCSKRMATTEGWCKCNDFEYSDRYIKQLQQENKKYKEVIDKAIEYINENLIISSILDGKKYYTINNYSFDYRELLDILKGVNND